MFDAPIDGLYAWLGVAAASAAVLGVALGLPTAAPPDAVGAASTVDRIATTDHAASARLPVDADAVSIAPNRVGLRNDAGATHAQFAYGPVVPVRRGTRLWTVLAGAPVEAVFGSVAELRRTARELDSTGRWRQVDGPLRVRHLVVGGHDVVLVGA